MDDAGCRLKGAVGYSPEDHSDEPLEKMPKEPLDRRWVHAGKEVHVGLHILARNVVLDRFFRPSQRRREVQNQLLLTLFLKNHE